GNILGAVKMAKYYELEEDDVVVTVLTDSAAMYGSRLLEMNKTKGSFSEKDASVVFHASMLHQTMENALELSYYDKLRIHNLKYYTWIEQQGKELEELNAQWYDREYWTRIQALVPVIDKLINEFNAKVGLV
ncbi:MAG: pyridoxal-5-phosphate-dependent protein subunit beta, partial [Spirochaetales bacterium]|nr:pyridoxal-5-phosphate-dependent protein subunit beta [Spirochaetales bacterium]